MIANLLAPLSMKIAAGIIALLLFAVPLSYCKGRADGRDLERARQAEIAARAATQRLEAARRGQQAYEAERALRGAETDELRRRADAAPDGGEAGPKTRAVLDGLRR